MEDVEVRLGTNIILYHLNIEIFPKQVVALIGPNGSGKTTLLRTILGVYKPTHGKVAVNAHRIGYVPQRLSFDRSIPLSVKELLYVYSQKSVEEIEEKLEMVGCLNLLKSNIGNLSGGELQRVLIANALLANPELLLLDEATAGVDIAAEHNFYDLLENLHKQYEMTVVMVSHELHMVYRHATRVYCLQGTIRCQGTPGEVVVDKTLQEVFGNYLVPYEHEHHNNH
jgi:ABC-type Mn2+/Zn2+ transport system ATPase subunit